MLANGTLLKYKTEGASSFTNAPGLHEIPELGSEEEKVDRTDLAAKNKKYEYGIGDYGDLEYKFIYENSSATSPYRVFRQAQADKETLSFQEVLPDGTTFEFRAMCNVKLGGGGVNGGIDFTLKLALQSDMEVTDPS
ncbi:MAG: phage tail protein [Lachnospiraceae bacterium]|nr:phage tail protein [Lachnospiraceae bacterium]